MQTLPAALRDRPMRPLAIGLVSALGIAGLAAWPDDAVAAKILHVMNCLDNGAGSLRDTIAAVDDGGTVILDDTLPCSTITLTSGEIAIAKHSLYISGPGGDSMSISGDGKFGVLRHSGTGQLGITGLIIRDGKYTSSTQPFGGCIYSAGNVGVEDSIVANCTAVGSGAEEARGGGVYARGNFALKHSTISGNVALGTGADARGGGIYVRGKLTAKYSIVRDNEAVIVNNHFSVGGGMWTEGDAYMRGSLVTGNKAMLAAAIGSEAALGATSLDIINSTISKNTASFRFAGIYTHVPLTLSNSTIAFNTAPDGGAVYVIGAPIKLKSSIIADNASNGMPADLDGVFVPPPAGYNNLITSSTIGKPKGTITACPKLGPLAANGAAAMMTHALLSTSPAVDSGSNPDGLQVDQRGAGFARVFGAHTDIGAFERQGTKDDRLFVSGFEPVCDH